VPTSASLAKRRTPIEIKLSTDPIQPDEEKPKAPPAESAAIELPPLDLEPPPPRPTPKRKVLYTCLTGGYDQLIRQPKAPGWDYIAFVDETPAAPQGWDIRLIEKRNLDPLSASRMPKLLPHRFLQDYDFSLYLDANMALKAPPTKLCQRADWPDFANTRHPWRRCVYAELEAIEQRGKADAAHVEAQIERYRKAGMPEWNGMWENGVLMRRHMDPDVIALDEVWWEEYLRSETGRDQPALAFTLWRLKRTIQRISATERSRWIKLRPHGAKRKEALREAAA